MAPQPCPCSSGLGVDECCGPILDGTITAPTAERLMRSRFTAFARSDAAHLLRTWHSATRPRTVDLDPNTRWTRLDVHSAHGGGPFHTEGTVEYTAYHRTGRDGSAERPLHQIGAFARENGQWKYVD